MLVVDAIAKILALESTKFLSCYPTTPLIDAAAKVGIRPIVCRQERVGVGIADGYTRVAENGRIGVFAMQYGPGAENAYSGIATAYSDGTPILLLPTGHQLDRAQMRPLFSATRSFGSITKSVETLIRSKDVADVMRRAFSALRSAPSGPAMVEIPMDIARAEVAEDAFDYVPPLGALSGPAPDDVERALEALIGAASPVIFAGQGVLRAGASAELVDLAELLGIPVITSLEGKSAFPERNPLSLGVATVVASDQVLEFLRGADTVFAIGASLTRHFTTPRLPTRAKLVHSTNDARDLNKFNRVDYPILGDAKLVLRTLLDAARDRKLGALQERRRASETRIAASTKHWLDKWLPKLTSNELPITPYRALHEFMGVTDPDQTILTHDSGSPRDQIVPFYRAGGPNTYLGWGKSHALGSGLGLTMGAKLAAPEKLCAHFLGDAAFGMTGLDIETAARSGIPILSIVLNNSTMAIESTTLVESHERFGTRDVRGNYAAIAEALSVPARRVEEPGALAAAFEWAIRATRDGSPALLEIITSAETAFSNRPS